MEINQRIQAYRASLGLSQEELAQRVYVTRQTVSNWETGKTYPDIHSLLLLSGLFQVSLDQLIKGDVEQMKKEIQETDIRRLNRYGWLLAVLMAVTILSAAPLAVWLGIYGLLIWAVPAGAMMTVAHRTEKLKKQNNIYTYREILAFTQGKRLDQLETARESGKRPYQRFLLAVASGLIAAVVLTAMFWLLDR